MNRRFISKVLVIALLASCLVVFSGCFDEAAPDSIDFADIINETPEDAKKSETPANDDDKAEGIEEARNGDDNQDAEGNGDAEDNKNNNVPLDNNNSGNNIANVGANTDTSYGELIRPSR